MLNAHCLIDLLSSDSPTQSIYRLRVLFSLLLPSSLQLMPTCRQAQVNCFPKECQVIYYSFFPKCGLLFDTLVAITYFSAIFLLVTELLSCVHSFKRSTITVPLGLLCNNSVALFDDQYRYGCTCRCLSFEGLFCFILLKPHVVILCQLLVVHRLLFSTKIFFRY